MNAQEFIKFCEGFSCTDYKSLAEGLMHGEHKYAFWGVEPPKELENITLTSVDSYGGEDQGSTYYHVYKVEQEGEDTFFVKFYGYYASHYGTDYGGAEEVTPKEKIITEYS